MVLTRRQLSGRPNGIGSSNTEWNWESGKQVKYWKRASGREVQYWKGSRREFQVNCADWAGHKTRAHFGSLADSKELARTGHGIYRPIKRAGLPSRCSRGTADPLGSVTAVVKTAKAYTTSPLHGFVVWCSPAVTICTASVTFNNSPFCPHSVFMCFVWISEQTAFISLYNIN